MFAIPRLAPIVTFFQLAFAVFAAFMFAFSPEFLEQFGIAEDSADPPTRFLAGGIAVMYAHHSLLLVCMLTMLNWEARRVINWTLAGTHLFITENLMRLDSASGIRQTPVVMLHIVISLAFTWAALFDDTDQEAVDPEALRDAELDAREDAHLDAELKNAQQEKKKKQQKKKN
eukprot:TRINITY_DN790_c0_g1_i1.p2 TRINITY_DN790_c0_g1~~TRINITY_DN790_c0_g1_i1.p2  ORF type:complete len:188 (-),score=68.26 TRINITY_DN790_c0_g1_i1:44-562(-)